MIRFILFISIILFINPLITSAQKCGQRHYYGKVGITTSYGVNNIFQSNQLDGAPSITGKEFFSFGASYVFELIKPFDLEWGLDYLNHSINTTSNLPPDSPTIEQSYDLALANLSLAIRANFLNYFFVNGGAIAGLDLSSTSPIAAQDGIGAIAGIGANYDFYSGMSLFVNPFVRIHSLIPFSSNNNQQRLFESGVRVGISFDLDKVN